MSPLISALLGTAAPLVGLCLVIQGGWWLVLRLIDPLLERSRLSVQQERARQLALQRIRVVDLDGQVCWLRPEELRACAGTPTTAEIRPSGCASSGPLRN